MLIDLIKAFLIGGALCLIGQIFVDFTKLTPARILTGYVVSGVVLGAIGIYGPFAEFAGAGALTPLTGFGYILAKGVKEEIETNGAIGIITGGMGAAAGGITAALLFGFLMSLIFKAKEK